ncbi:MAG: hypothetical protein KDD53_08840 [Bdellovibrionales bacterium]|nr:hypothetical protein [Bdellovibrionales bacterium]
MELGSNIQNLLTIVGVAAFLMIAVQVCLSIVMVVVLRTSARERSQLNKEMFGLVKRIEGLTSGRRDQMLQHYDRMLENLANRLPVMVTGQVGTQIFETESRVLKRLAELEPHWSEDEDARRKMDELIRTMECLEDSLIATTSEAVTKIMNESRRELIEDERFFGVNEAA